MLNIRRRVSDPQHYNVAVALNLEDAAGHAMTRSARQSSPFRDLVPIEPLPSDDPTMREIWSMIAVRRRSVAIVTLIAIVASAITAFLFQPRFVYSSSFEIGPARGPASTETIVAKLQETYIPQARDAFRRAHPDQATRVPSIAVRVPAGSTLVVFESRGTVAARPMHEELHRATLELIERDQLGPFAATQHALQAELDEATHRRDQAADQITLIEAKLEQIESTRRILERRRARLLEAISTAQRDRTSAAQTRDASAVLIADQEILAAEDRVAAIDQDLSVGLTAERDTLEQSTAEATRLQATQTEIIERTKRDLANLRPAAMLAVTRQSDAPVGATAPVIFALGSLGGLLTGILIAIVAGLIDRDRRRTAAAT